MRFGRFQCLILTAALAGALGAAAAQAGPLAVIANYTDPGLTAQPPWPPGTVTILDTATDKPVASLTVGVNPQAVAITPDGKTAVVACSQSSDIWFIDLTANPPKVTGNVSLGTGMGDTFYPESVAISPDAQYVVVAPLAQAASADGTSIQHFSATRSVDIVSMSDHTVSPVDLQSDQLLDENGKPFAGAAEAVAISGKGALVILSPSTKVVGLGTGEIYALPFSGGQINFPDTADGQMVGVAGHTGFNIALTPDGSMGIIPLWRDPNDKKGYFDVATIDDTGKLVANIDALGNPIFTQTKVDAGGSGTHSVAISADGTKAYVRNLLSPGNIAVFQINADHTVTDTKLRLNADGIPDSVWQLAQGQLGGVLGTGTDPQSAGGFVGSQMVSVTPDGKKVYAVNPFAGTPDPIFSLLGIDGYGDGELQVFNAGQPAPIATLMGGSSGPLGKNSIAIAIQQQVP